MTSSIKGHTAQCARCCFVIDTASLKREVTP